MEEDGYDVKLRKITNIYPIGYKDSNKNALADNY